MNAELERRKNVAEEELLLEGVHNKDLTKEIVTVLGKAEVWQLKIILRFVKRIIE